MKVDMNKLRGPDKAIEMNDQSIIYRRLAKKTACFVVCLLLFGIGTIGHSALNNDHVSADELYDESSVNPSFTVQHMGDVAAMDIQSGDGMVTVLTDSGSGHVELMDDGTLETAISRVPLYEDYITNWQETNSIAAASFLNGADGSTANGYVLKEIWFGQNADSMNQSDFLVLSVRDGDISPVRLTNNPEHPNLSETAGGYYVADGYGEYMICIRDGDVIRLVFSMEEDFDYQDVKVFDYDVSDGGYYLEEDYYQKDEIHATSGQSNEDTMIYVDAIENGIHSSGNYSGKGAKFAFGGANIGTDLSNESLSGELDTLNVWNYAQQEATSGTGVTKGIVTGVAKNGLLQWADNISYPDLFGTGVANGKTSYTNEEYTFVFERKGFSRTLSSVQSVYGVGTENLTALTSTGNMRTNRFWIMDTAPSYGTDGHDPMWGSGLSDISYYRNNDRAPEMFQMSDDGQDHNSFFGFCYTEDFTLSPGYVGPLSFFGYSDDDMWAFIGRVDENGQIMPDTVKQAADLGGVHDGAAYYCNMWDVIDKVPYGEEGQDWRLFVFWLERDGASASCYMNFILPEASIMDQHETGSVMIEAGNYTSENGAERTFLLDDGTCNRYQGSFPDGTSISIVSGKEFVIPGGSFINIIGLTAGDAFTVNETGKSKVWVSTGNGYEEMDGITGVVGTDTKATFLSTANDGMLTITADANGTPDGGYGLKLSMSSVKNMEISAMDGNYNPLGSRFTDDEGQLLVTLAAGETLVLYNLPNDIGFTLEPQDVPGWQVSEILLDNAEASGISVSGQFPAHVIYRYEEKEIQSPRIAIEQSVGDEWGTQEISLGVGTLISYKLIVSNPNDTPMNITVEDNIPEGLTVMPSSLSDDAELMDQTLRIQRMLAPDSIIELSFTCQVTADESCELKNSAWIMIQDEAVKESNIVTAIIP